MVPLIQTFDFTKVGKYNIYFLLRFVKMYFISECEGLDKVVYEINFQRDVKFW